MHYYELKIYDEQHQQIIFTGRFRKFDDVDAEIYRHMRRERNLNLHKFMKRVHVEGLNGRCTIRLFDSDSGSGTDSDV
jgi:hypothetical protein